VHSFMPRRHKISPVQFWILLVLSEGPNYGYRIMQRLKDMFKGYWQPKAGTIYPALEKLSKESLITCKVEHREGAPDRHYYTITKKGEEVLKETVIRWSKVMEHIEAYGEAHRAIQRFKGDLNREEVGNLLIKMGEGVKKGAFDLSEIIPSLESVVVEPTEPLRFKLLYAWENGKLEIELEFEWVSTERGEEIQDE